MSSVLNARHIRTMWPFSQVDCAVPYLTEAARVLDDGGVLVVATHVDPDDADKRCVSFILSAVVTHRPLQRPVVGDCSGRPESQCADTCVSMGCGRALPGRGRGGATRVGLHQSACACNTDVQCYVIVWTVKASSHPQRCCDGARRGTDHAAPHALNFTRLNVGYRKFHSDI